MVVTGLDGTIEDVNATFQTLTGYSAEEAVGLNIRELKSGQHGPEFYQDLWRTLQVGQVWRGHFHNRKKNGDLFWEKATIAPVLDGLGQISSFVAVKEDVTEPMRTEAGLKAAKNAAEAASQAKSMFLNNMSHELRTPLNAVLGFIHLLQDTSLTPSAAGIPGQGRGPAGHLHGIISDILDFTKIEAGPARSGGRPVRSRGHPRRELAGTLSQRAAEKGLRFSWWRRTRTSARVLGIPCGLGQVLLNLAATPSSSPTAGR